MGYRERSGWHLPADDSYFGQFRAPTEYKEGPPSDRNGFYREHLFTALKYVTRWECAIDVGAHVGWWCWDMAHKFKKVYAFEPAPRTYECLVKNVEPFDNVVTYNCAVGNKAGVCIVKDDSKRPGNSGSKYVMPGTGDVRMVALDDLEFPTCNFLKIDVEGFELRALEGARRLIKRCRPVISMECTDWKFEGRYGIPKGSAERWILKCGYREAYHMRPDKVFVPN